MDMTSALFPDYKYDVAISYSRQDAGRVRPVAEFLADQGLRVFFDTLDHVVVTMVGKELLTELPRVYGKESANCLIFVSANYAQSQMAKKEMLSALAAALEREDFLTPIRLDDTEIDGLSPTTVYLDATPGGDYEDPKDLQSILLQVMRYRAGIPADGPLSTEMEVPEEAPTREVDAEADLIRTGPSPRAYFEVLLPQILAHLGNQATDLDCSIRWMVTGPDGGFWLVRLAPPEAKVYSATEDSNDIHNDWQRKKRPRHLSIKTTAQEMRKMLVGTFDARQAIIEGNVELQGDLTVLQSAGELFRNAPRHRSVERHRNN